jgi:hypothetical protein
MNVALAPDLDVCNAESGALVARAVAVAGVLNPNTVVIEVPRGSFEIEGFEMAPSLCVSGL